MCCQIKFWINKDLELRNILLPIFDHNIKRNGHWPGSSNEIDVNIPGNQFAISAGDTAIISNWIRFWNVESAKNRSDNEIVFCLMQNTEYYCEMTT